MNVRQCKRCNKLFNYGNNPLCPACVQQIDEQFNDVRNYINENPNATMDTICEATGVDPADVRRWLREGRLILSRESASLLTCESCGAPIKTGRYCGGCSNAVRSKLDGAAKSMKPPPPPPPKPAAFSSDGKMHVDFRKK